MTSAMEVREMPPQRLLVKKTTCGHKDIGPAFGAAIHSVGECLRASGTKMASMPTTVYLQWRDSDCDMAVGCQVQGNVMMGVGCEWLDVPGGPHIFASHFGPYDTLHETHKAIRDACAAKNLKISGPCWETYPTDPGLELDSSKWQTDVYYPVRAF
jgi:effector-binding domain-containing protein